jgi:hypothetical protein
MAVDPTPGLAGWVPLQLAVAREGEAGGERKQRGAQLEESRRKGASTLSGKVRDSPFPPLGFIDLREPRSPNRARRAH